MTSPAQPYQPRRAALYRPEYLTFVNHYVATALQLSDEELGTNALAAELAEATGNQLETDCLAFLTNPAVTAALEKATQRTFAQAGTDFWLTRCGHGTGYWDRSQVYGEAASQALDKACKSYPTADWYRGDDELIYQS
jgi:hypothetical protein